MTQATKNEIMGWIRLVTLLVGLSVATGKILGDVQNNTKAIQANTAAIQDNAKRIGYVETRCTITETQMVGIKEVLDEIHIDVKQLLKK